MTDIELARKQLRDNPKAFMAPDGWNWRAEGKALALEEEARRLRLEAAGPPSLPWDSGHQERADSLLAEAAEWRAILRNR
jgi:hypothetical protein